MYFCYLETSENIFSLKYTVRLIAIVDYNAVKYNFSLYFCSIQIPTVCTVLYAWLQLLASMLMRSDVSQPLSSFINGASGLPFYRTANMGVKWTSMCHVKMSLSQTHEHPFDHSFQCTVAKSVTFKYNKLSTCFTHFVPVYYMCVDSSNWGHAFIFQCLCFHYWLCLSTTDRHFLLI